MDAKRDWGFAKEYVEGMWRMLQVDEPDTYMLATSPTEAVWDFVSLAALAAGMQIVFQGAGEKEVTVVRSTGKTIVRVNPRFYRPVEVELLIGSADKAREKMGWKPTTTLEQLCDMMVKADLQRNARGSSF
jgi:GDPmannose 4,6-dehydratase